MKPLTIVILASLLLAPSASANASTNLNLGDDNDPYGLRCDHDSPEAEQEHDTYCYVIIGGQRFVIHTDELHHTITGSQQTRQSASTPGVYVAIASDDDGDPVGYGCEIDDDLNHSCWFWIHNQKFTIHFPRVDELMP